MTQAKRTERGWPGHYICAQDCLFRRNTLIEHADIKIVVSTVGNYRDSDGKIKEIGCNRYYETMAFHSNPGDTIYHDAGSGNELPLLAKHGLDYYSTPSVDNDANDMHEGIVAEIMERLQSGDEFKEAKDDAI